MIIFYIFGIASVLGICSVAYFVFMRWNFKGFIPILSIFMLFSCYMIFAQYLKYRSLHVYVDFSHWAQIIHNICTTGKPLILSVELVIPGAANFLSVHFIPFIYVFALFFKIWPFVETLIVLDFLFMISAAIPLYKLALIHYQDRRFSLFMTALLLWYPTFQYIILYEFGMLQFSIPIILWMLYFWEKRNTFLYFLFAIFALLIREEVGLTLMMFGLYVLVFRKRRISGLITALLGGGAFILITQVIMPAFHAGGTYGHVAMGSFNIYGDSIGKVALNILQHPEVLLVSILQPMKLANIFMLFLPLLFIPLLSPVVLMSILANLGVGALSTSLVHISYMLHYISPSIPFIFYAFIKGWPKLIAVLKKLTTVPAKTVAIEQAAMGAVFSGLLVTNLFFGPSPLSMQFWCQNLKPAPFRTQNFHYSAYQVTDHHRRVERLCNLIPDSAVVSAQHFLHSRLFKKRAVMAYPQIESLDKRITADYVIFDKTNNGLKQGGPVYKTQRDFDLVEKDIDTWELVMAEDGYFLYRRKN